MTTRPRLGRVLAMPTPPADEALMQALAESEGALCSRCEASFPAPGDTLCRECRWEVDVAYGDLPGAEP